jgi:hypothetical protein
LSLQAELDEVLEWLSALTRSERPVTREAPEPMWREDWQHVARLLKAAAERFASLRGVLEAPEDDPEPADAQFAGDLQRETENLFLRASMLSRRVPPEPSVEPPPSEHRRAGTDLARRTHKPKKPPHVPTSADAAALAASAGRTIERARDLLGTDEVSLAFENELDLLAEMTMSLRQDLTGVRPTLDDQDDPAAEEPLTEVSADG